MTHRNDLVAHLDRLLVINDIEDSAWNGLQIQGNNNVKHVGVAVDSGLEVFQQAARDEIDFLIVHHGLFWKNSPPNIISYQYDRVRSLLNVDISLYAAHLPLDRHRALGNNAELIRLCGADVTEPFLMLDGANVSWRGIFAHPTTIEAVQKKIISNLKVKPRILPFGPAKISTIAVCSGAGGYNAFFSALKLGADLYISGDTADIYQLAKDAGVHVIFAGHHATETLGLKALAKKIEADFDLITSFIAFPTNL